MAGSRKYLKYTADNGTVYAANIDESNGEYSNFGFTDYATGENNPVLPKGLVMRHVLLGSQTGTNERTSRKLYIGTNGAVAAILALASILLPWYVGAGGFMAFVPISYKAEKSVIAKSDDTGLLDGDAT